ncbi:MAG: hypothetical protein PS018_12075 [bacterium]|nr:hypothetical protein [bacterium]
MPPDANGTRDGVSRHYLVFEGDEPDSWRWAVTLDDDVTKTGKAKTRNAAMAEVVLVVDRSLSVLKKPPGR